MQNAECRIDMNDLKKFCEGLDVRNLQTLSIAYVGDAYYHLFVRIKLLKIKYKVNDLHSMSSKIVSAVAQSKTYQAIEKILTAEEKEIFQRGRNAKSHSTHSASNVEYHNSTGFETLLGQLFIEGKYDRLEEIANEAFNIALKNFI
ncbi:MAG: ribonuclease III [Selenomonadaceae bacterium]|nr:ribonuclease III [Selenomonadaceae bacterium]